MFFYYFDCFLFTDDPGVLVGDDVCLQSFTSSPQKYNDCALESKDSSTNTSSPPMASTWQVSPSALLNRSGTASPSLFGSGANLFDDLDENSFEIDGDSIDGSTYVPSEIESESDGIFSEEEVNEGTHSRGSLKRRSHNSSLEVSMSVNVQGRSTRDDSLMFVAAASGKNGCNRKSYCMFCQTNQSKLVRHLENKHRDVEEVQKFADLPKNNAERLQIIQAIRKQSMFDFNTNNNVNDGELMVCRRPNATVPRQAKDYKVCQKCKGFYLKNNIRHHAKKCFGYNGSKSRTLLVYGRKILGRIHSDACKLLREVIFPVMREDDVVRLIRYDTLIIAYGNKLCCLYGNQQHQHDLVRSQLRLLGRFLSALRQINKEVTDLASIYQPKFYNDTIVAINRIASFDPDTGSYGSPSTAYSIGAALKKVAAFYVTECIKRDDVESKLKTEDFQKLLIEDIAVSVNKGVTDSQTLLKRRKKVDLPSASDINQFHHFLKENRSLAYNALEIAFDYTEWLKLAQFTLISVQLFNRRRAGEIERVLIDDFKNYEGVNDDEFKRMDSKNKKIANNYVRFTIRGKLNRTVPVLLTGDLLKCINKILEHRLEANVNPSNKFVFGVRSADKSRHSYLRACMLMRKFALESGVAFPTKITGTKLRKHIATNCINLNLSENEVADVANFMGHADKIHREHYRQPIVSREILRMSKVLELAQCGDGDDQESDSESDEEGDLSKKFCKSFKITTNFFYFVLFQMAT